MDAYGRRLGLHCSELRVAANGECVAPDDAAETLRRQDGDLIDVTTT